MKVCEGDDSDCWIVCKLLSFFMRPARSAGPLTGRSARDSPHIINTHVARLTAPED
jgi:hypothetical protein